MQELFVYRKEGQSKPLGNAFLATCANILALAMRILLFPIEVVKRCFTQKQKVKFSERKISDRKSNDLLVAHASLRIITPQKALPAVSPCPKVIEQVQPNPVPKPLGYPMGYPKSLTPLEPLIFKRCELGSRLVLKPCELGRRVVLKPVDPGKPVIPKPSIPCNSPGNPPGNPLAAPDPQLAPNLEDFKDFLASIKLLDKGRKSPITALSEEIEKLSPSELQQNLAQYHKRLLDALSLETLGKQEDYLAAIRKFLADHPQTNLFPLVGLKDPDSGTFYVPRLLASYESPAIAAALQEANWREKDGIFASPLFADRVGEKIAGFIEKNAIRFDHIAQAVNLYETSHELMMEKLLQECRREILHHIEWSMRVEDLLPLWNLAKQYEDAALQIACANYALKQPDSLKLPKDLAEKCGILRQITPLLVAKPWIDAQQNVRVTLKQFERSLLEGCKNVGVTTVDILYASPRDEVDQLKDYQVLDLDYLPCAQNPEQLVVKNLAQLLTDNKVLRELHLRIARLNSVSAEQLAQALMHVAHLSSFELRYCDVDPKALPVITDFLAQSSLTRATLRGISLSAEGLNLLAEGLKRNGSIRHLSFPGNSFSDAAKSSFIEALKDRVPKLEIAF